MEDYSVQVVELLTQNEIGFNIMFHSPADQERAEEILKASPYWDWWNE